MQLHAVDLSIGALQESFRLSNYYLDRFRNRLNAVHLLHLKRFVTFLKTLGQFADQYGRDETTSQPRNTPDVPDVLSVSTLMERLGPKVDGLNLLELKSYLKTSKVRAQDILPPA